MKVEYFHISIKMYYFEIFAEIDRENAIHSSPIFKKV